MASKYDPFKEQIIAQDIPASVLAETIECTESAIRSVRWKFLNPKSLADQLLQFNSSNVS